MIQVENSFGRCGRAREQTLDLLDVSRRSTLLIASAHADPLPSSTSCKRVSVDCTDLGDLEADPEPRAS